MAEPSPARNLVPVFVRDGKSAGTGSSRAPHSSDIRYLARQKRVQCPAACLDRNRAFVQISVQGHEVNSVGTVIRGLEL